MKKIMFFALMGVIAILTSCGGGVEGKIDKLNDYAKQYGEAVKANDKAKADQILQDAYDLNEELQAEFEKMSDSEKKELAEKLNSKIKDDKELQHDIAVLQANIRAKKEGAEIVYFEKQPDGSYEYKLSNDPTVTYVIRN